MYREGKIKVMFFAKEPIGQAYKDLVDFASTICTTFILVKRSQSFLEINSSCDEVLDEFESYKIISRSQNNWPGTILCGHNATVYYYLLNHKSKELLKKHAKGLFSWIHPALPEDLCFLKSDGNPWLISIAHEREAWVDTEKDEEIEKLKSIKGIALVNADL